MKWNFRIKNITSEIMKAMYRKISIKYKRE